MNQETFSQGETTKAKLTLQWSAYQDEWDPVISGGEMDQVNYVEFMGDGEGANMWPIIFSKEPIRITVEALKGKKLIQIQLKSRISQGFVFNHGSGDIWWKDTFSCTWRDLNLEGDITIYKGEALMIDEGIYASPATDTTKSKISLGDCGPDDSGDKKTAICSLKVVTGSDLMFQSFSQYPKTSTPHSSPSL